MGRALSDEEKLLEFLYAAPVGLVEIDASGTISMINPYAMKHLLPLAGKRSMSNLFSILENCAPELRNLFNDFVRDRGMICDSHRIVVNLKSCFDEGDVKVLACTMVKLDLDRAIASLSDITQQAAQERRLKQAETWITSLLNDVNDYAVLSITSGGIVDSANASWAKQTGYDCDTVIGRALSDVVRVTAEGGKLGTREQLRLTARDGWHLDESWHSRKDRSHYRCQRLLAARTGEDGALTGYTVVLRDIAPQRHDAGDLRRLLTQDHLTGAVNRSHFQQVLEREQREWHAHGAPLSLIMIDIDHFKQVNDRYGHPAGDLVLGRFARTIANTLRPSDVLARLGGEEFAVLLPATTLAEAVEIAERLRGYVAEMRVELPGGFLTVTASFGCSTSKLEADLLGSADAALYIAKAEGRDRVRATDFAVLAA